MCGVRSKHRQCESLPRGDEPPRGSVRLRCCCAALWLGWLLTFGADGDGAAAAPRRRAEAGRDARPRGRVDLGAVDVSEGERGRGGGFVSVLGASAAARRGGTRAFMRGAFRCACERSSSFTASPSVRVPGGGGRLTWMGKPSSSVLPPAAPSAASAWFFFASKERARKKGGRRGRGSNCRLVFLELRMSCWFEAC